MNNQYLSSTRKIKVYAKALEPGMFVCELDRPWIDTPFLLQGFLLESVQDVEVVREVCHYVYVDLEKSEGRKTANSGVKPKKPRKYSSRVPVEDEIGNAKETYQRSHALLKSTMEDIRFGNAINTEAIKEIVSGCVDSILRNSNAMMLLSQIKNKDEYTSQHSLNVCILSIMLGRQLGYEVKDLHEIGYSGLLHDMGKMRTPIEILNKEGNLTADEFEIMKRHTIEGMKILMSANGIPGSAVDVAHSHHERLDGLGYPRGLSAEGITPYSRAVAIADTYDAITSDRPYSDGRPHLNALNILAKGRGQLFDPRFVISFIACIGIYPPGSIVELKSGEIGIVIEVTEKTKSKPKVLIVLDEHKQPCKERIVDLSHSANIKRGIRQVLKKTAYGVDIQKYLEKGLIIRGFSFESSDEQVASAVD